MTFAVWADNSFVKTLSNFHSPEIVKGGLQRRVRDLVTKRRDRDPSDVNCPAQQQTYCKTYHWIDKGNAIEAKYDLSTESHLHGWGPKLAARYFNININNAYKLYVALFTEHHPNSIPMPLKECIHNLAHSLLQQGDDVRRRGVGASPSAVKDITTSVCSDGRKVRSDAHRQPFSPTIPNGQGQVHTGTAHTPTSSVSTRALHYQQAAFHAQKRKHPWRSHQPVPILAKGTGHYCQYKKCPGLDNPQKRPRPYKTYYRCEECTMDKGDNVWLCSQRKMIDGKQQIVSCHMKYHMQNFEGSTGTTRCSVESDLTEGS